MAVTWPSTRVGSGVVKISSLGTFGKWRMPSTVSKSAASHFDDGSRPIVTSVPGPWSRMRVEAPLGQPGGDLAQHAAALAPRARRIVLVEPADVCDRVPQPVERLLLVEVRDGRAAPTRRSAPATTRPVRRRPVDDVADVRQVGEDVPAGARRVDPVERVRRSVPGQRDPGRVLVRAATRAGRPSTAARSPGSTRRRARAAAASPRGRRRRRRPSALPARMPRARPRA